MSVDTILAAARSQLGYIEGPRNDTKFGQWYGMNYNPWCDMFLSWCADQASEGKVVGKFAYTPDHMRWFMENDKFGLIPKRGALVFFKWPGSTVLCNHIGIVEAVNSDLSIATIEGNSGPNSDRVLRLPRKSHIAGYGYPAYAGGEWKNPHPYPGTVIKFGSRGNTVGEIQERLNAKKYNVGKVDNVFGSKTLGGVNAFQKFAKIEVDGKVGPITWKRLFA